MATQTYEEYKREQEKLAQAQALDRLKKGTSENVKELKKPVSKVNRILNKLTKSTSKKSKTSSFKAQPKLSKSLLSYSNAFGGSSSSQKTSGGKVGKPLGFRKWRSPFTGKPIPATEYYKEMRLFKKIQTQKAAQTEQLKQIELAKRGINPNQVNIQQQVQQQVPRQIPQQMPQQIQRRLPIIRRNIPNQMYPEGDPRNLPIGTVVPAGNRIWKYARGQVGQEGGLFGPVRKIYGTEQSFWN